MIASISARSLLVALALICLGDTSGRPSFQAIDARSTRNEEFILDDATASTTTTTTSTPSDNLEDPSNAVATSGEVPDDYCFRCSDKVTVAENLIALHTNLLAKKKALIRKNKATAAAANQKHVINSSPTPATPPNRADEFSSSSSNDNRNSSPGNNNRRHSMSIRNRTLEYPATAPSSSSMSVISRLLVVRSAPLTEQPPTIISDTTTTTTITNNNQKNKLGRNKKGPALSLDRLQHELDHQWNATCDSLLEVRICVRELAPTCIGDLQFHSLETWSYQELSKFSCPIEKGSRVKPWPGLNTRYYNYLDQPLPVARPVTSPEAIRERLGQMFPNGAIRPPGVVLRPTVNTNQNFNSGNSGGGGVGHNLIVASSSSNNQNSNTDRRRLFNIIVTYGVFVFAAFVSIATIFIFISRERLNQEGISEKN